MIRKYFKEFALLLIFEYDAKYGIVGNVNTGCGSHVPSSITVFVYNRSMRTRAPWKAVVGDSNIGKYINIW
jgi:hypothetical protein